MIQYLIFYYALAGCIIEMIFNINCDADEEKRGNIPAENQRLPR
jgi:NADH:ubiquinone oxidoreductase subunit B-like Fe-S oxidoreductase